MTNKLALNRQKNCHGFTLIEIISVLAIIALLTSIAVPSYQRYMLRAKCTQAQIMLLDIAAKLEQYYGENHTFLGANIVEKNDALQSKEYTFSIENLTANSYTVSATTTSSAKNTVCHKLTLNNMNKREPQECWL